MVERLGAGDEVVSSFLCKRLVESCALFRESVFP
jgi:hypothetical protein